MRKDEQKIYTKTTQKTNDCWFKDYRRTFTCQCNEYYWENLGTVRLRFFLPVTRYDICASNTIMDICAFNFDTPVVN